MKSLFPGYFSPTAAERKALFAEAIISFDTNVLRNLYRLSREKSDEFLTTMTKLKGRVWLPHQVALEFVRGRVPAIKEQLSTYESVEKELRKLASYLKGQIQRHPLMPVENYLTRINEIIAEIGALKNQHVDTTHDDSIGDKLHEIFDNKIGPEPDETKKKDWVKQFDQRYAAKTPPGFEDAKKPGAERKYGDAYIWFELIEHVTVENKPIVFVTEDKKEDWWQEINGETVGPHPELCQEMFEKTKQRCHIYRTVSFLQVAAEYLKEIEPKELIKEVRDIEEQHAVARSVPAATTPLFTFSNSESALLRALRGEIGYPHRGVDDVSASVLRAMDAVKVPTQIVDFGRVLSNVLAAQRAYTEPLDQYMRAAIELNRLATSPLNLALKPLLDGIPPYAVGAEQSSNETPPSSEAEPPNPGEQLPDSSR